MGSLHPRNPRVEEYGPASPNLPVVTEGLTRSPNAAETSTMPSLSATIQESAKSPVLQKTHEGLLSDSAGRYGGYAPSPTTSQAELEGFDDEAVEPKSFERIKSGITMHKSKGAVYAKVGEEGINRMHKFSLYETVTRFYLVGADLMDQRFRVLKVDRTAPPNQLNLFEDEIVYNKTDMNQLLNTIDDGNKGTGGMKLKCSSWGILGFIRFTECYYMVLITKRKHVAMLGGHYIHQIDGTELIPLTTGSLSKFQQNRNADESRYLAIFGALDLSRSFYFSYSYNITRTLQRNIIRGKLLTGARRFRPSEDINDMFVWNHHLLHPALEALKCPYDWCHPIIHGFIDQKCKRRTQRLISSLTYRSQALMSSVDEYTLHLSQGDRGFSLVQGS